MVQQHRGDFRLWHYTAIPTSPALLRGGTFVPPEVRGCGSLEPVILTQSPTCFSAASVLALMQFPIERYGFW